jgi:hypothetical protein
MHPELNEHSQDNQSTRNVWHQPARILRHLKNRGGVIVIESGLEKGVPSVTQRIIHENQRFPIFVFSRIHQLDTAGKIFRDVRAGISIVTKLQELDGERLIEALGSKHDLAGLTGSYKT